MSAGLQAARFDHERDSQHWEHWLMSGPVTLHPSGDVAITFAAGLAALAWLRGGFSGTPSPVPAAPQAIRIAPAAVPPAPAAPVPELVFNPAAVPDTLARIIAQIVRATWSGDPSDRAWLAGPTGRRAIETVEHWFSENGNPLLGAKAAGPLAQTYADESGRVACRMVRE